MTKYVYHFREGNAQMRNLLGGKGANLAEMTRLGMPIPQGFTVTTEACNDWKARPAKSWAASTILFWSPCVPAPEPPCPA